MQEHKRLGWIDMKKKGMRAMKTRKILVVVDMQNDFVDGALGTKEAQGIVPSVVEKIKSYPKEDVFFTMDTHPENYMDTQEGKNLPVPHCIKGTKGWELFPPVKEASEGCQIIEKPTFGSVKLAECLRELAAENPLEVELVGLCTDICVISNALMIKAFLPETPVFADPACMAGVTPESHEAAITTMRACQIQML